MGMTLAREGEAAARMRPTSALLEQAWIWSVVGYTVLRFVVAWGAFSSHGANVWIFGLLDVGTAWPYAKAVAVICRRAARSEWRRLGLPLGVALVSFFLPYAYLWFAAGEMPAGLRIGFGICVAVLATAAALGISSQTRKLRRAASEESAGEVADNDEILIDLTTEPATLILGGEAADGASPAASPARR